MSSIIRLELGIISELSGVRFLLLINDIHPLYQYMFAVFAQCRPQAYSKFNIPLFLICVKCCLVARL